MHLDARFDTSRHADAKQHAVAKGGLAASGLYWFERLSGQPVAPPATIEAIFDAARIEDIVVPVHPAFMADAEAVSALAVRATGVVTLTIAATVFSTGIQGGSRLAGSLRSHRACADRSCVRSRIEDRAHRRQERPYRRVSFGARQPCGRGGQSLSRIVHRFHRPGDFGEADADMVLRPYAGVLLPGGSDMKNVAGQTAVAAFALENAVPAVGLCLGMQTMATAVAWIAFGRRGANLAEADPDAGIKTFLAMAGEEKAGGGLLPDHRSGDQITRPVAGTGLRILFPPIRPSGAITVSGSIR